MPKVKYDVDGVEPTGGDAVPAGVYNAAITSCEFGQSKNDNDMFTLELTIKGGPHDGRKLWHYVLPKQAEFRMREFTDALGLPTRGAIDTDAIVGTIVQVRTKVEKSEEYGEQARVKNLMPAVDGDGEEAEAPYTEWETSELSDEIEAREIVIEGRKTKAKMIAALEEDDAAAAGEEPADEDADEDEEEEIEEDTPAGITAEDVRVLERSDLKKLIKEEELDIKVLKSMSDEDLDDAVIAALGVEDDEADDEEDEEEEVEEDEEEAEDDEADDEEEADDYEAWDIADLKAELKERSLKPDGKKSVLIKRLRDNDASAEPF